MNGNVKYHRVNWTIKESDYIGLRKLAQMSDTNPTGYIRMMIAERIEDNKDLITMYDNLKNR